MRTSRRRAIRACCAAGVVVIAMLAQVDAARAQSCQTGNTNDFIKQGGFVQSDGRVHYTFRISDGITGAMRSAITDAIGRWNAQSASSNMALVDSWGTSQQLMFDLNDSIADPCAQFWQNGTYISMTSALATLAASDAAGYEWAVGSIAHEIGHYFRLKDMGADWSTLMGNPTSGSTCADMKANWEAGNGPNNVTASVAHNSEACVDDFRANYGPNGPLVFYDPSYYTSAYGSTCYDHWWATDYYYCYDGCNYSYTQYTYLGCW
jgi:hypothetical protein